MSQPDATFSARIAPMLFGREGDSPYGFHVDEVDGLSVGEVQEVGVAQSNGTGQLDLDNIIRDPRLVTISGVAKAKSMWELGKMEDLARGTLALPSSSGDLIWNEYGRTRTCHVRRYRGWRFERIGSTGAAEYTARFRAPSQLVFGDTTDLGPGTSLRAVNRGQFSAYPVIVITGTMPDGYRITAGGRSYIVTQALAAGQTHTIDMYDGVLLRNGAAQVRAVLAAPILTVPPNGHRTFVLDPVSGSGQMRITVRDTYI